MKIIKFLFKKTPFSRTAFFLISDVLLLSLALCLAFLLRFEGQIPEEYFLNGSLYGVVILSVIICLPLFYFFKLYSFSWSYVSVREVISLFKALTLGFILLGAIIIISWDSYIFSGFPRSVIFVGYFLSFIFCSVIRFSKRFYFIVVGKNNLYGKERTLIVGAGDTAEQIVRSIFSSFDSPYFPVGIVDDNKIKQGVSIHGIKVLGVVLDIPKIIKKYQISQIIVALPTAGTEKIKEAINLGREAGVLKIKIAPDISDIIQGKVTLKDLKNVDPEDLLGREKISLDTTQIERFIKSKTILITGAAGSIGSELSRQIAKFSPKILLLLDQDETGIFNITNEIKNSFPNLKTKSLISDVVDKEKINKIFTEFLPQIVFHAAAYKHVPLMEENVDEAIKNNIFGTKNLAEASNAVGVEKFVFISTDKAVNPTSVMGATKRVGEIICQQNNKTKKTKFISVRFGNVLNSRGSVIPTFREQIKKGGPVTVTDPKMERFFMLTSEACLLVMQAGAMGQGGEVFVLDMGKSVKILDLAKEMIRLSGYEPDKDIAIVFTGVRPGEKIFEEILTAEEGTMATHNKKIFIAKFSDNNLENLDREIKELQENIYKFNFQKNIEILKKIVPSFSVL